jgi:5'-nucleotidase
MPGLRSPSRLAWRRLAVVLLAVPAALWLSAWAPSPPASRTISIVGTTDLHGRIFASEGRGGLALLGGYLANLRAARAAEGGAVLLFDSGDTYQGGIESNLSEGAVVIDAYNALGYTAAAIGNHDFEFGAVDQWQREAPPTVDLRGALKARAAQARFPFLAANLREHGRPVAWPNVAPSLLTEATGVRVGVVGVMTHDALAMTLAANVGGLSVSPLVVAIAAEAGALRARGAQLVVVASHAGAECSAFDVPTDVTSCDEWGEIFDVARRLPRGLVNVMVAGHTHAAVAHEVNGVAIVQAYSWGRAFSRVDAVVDAHGHVTGTRVFAPQDVCARADAAGRCVADSTAGSRPAHYEGRPVVAQSAVTAAMAPALDRVAALRATPLGVTLDAVVARGAGDEESPLANLFADALRAQTPGADAAIGYAVGPGGLRADLPSGAVSIGALYDAYPFDNRAERMMLTGAELRELFTLQLTRPRWWGRAFGVAGLSVRLACDDGRARVDVRRDSGHAIGDDETITVALSDFTAARVRQLRRPGAVAAAAPSGPRPIVREVVARWLRQRGQVTAAEFTDRTRPRWAYTDGAASCRSQPLQP